MQKKIKISVIGAGHLGKYHINHLSKHTSIDFVGFYDVNQESAAMVAKEFSVKDFGNMDDLISISDAVHIVTPTNFHHEIAIKCLQNNKDVFIEKPITSNTAQANEIIELALSRKCIVQVGHIERFNPTINRLKDIVSEPHYIEIERLAPFQARGTEVPVVLDLMVHDIDLIVSMVDSNIIDIHASGAKMMSETVDLAHAHIKFENGVVANLKSSRIAQNYVRKIRTYQNNLYTITDLMIPQIEVYGLEKTSIFSAAPGALGPLMILAENEKTDLSQVATSHLIRLLIIITVIPFIIVNNTGSEALLLDNFDYKSQNHLNLILLIIASLFFIFIFDKIRVPAALLSGTLFASGLLQITDIASYKLPDASINFCLLILGASVGCRFAEKTVKEIANNSLHSIVATTILVLLGLIAAYVATFFVDTNILTLILSFSPGGIYEVAVIAIAFDLDPDFVAFHHIIRLLYILFTVPIILRVLEKIKK